MKHRRDDLCRVALVLLPLAWWWPLLADRLPDFMDTVTQIYPMRVAAARQLWSGTLPLLLPNIFSGVPLAANPQVSVWYPPQWFFDIAPGPTANGLVCIAHYIIAGLGIFAWVRLHTRFRAAALFAALTLQFSSMMVSHIALTPHLYTVAWIPWMLWAIDRQGTPARTAVATGAFVALQLLAGAPQVTYYTAMALPLYWLWRRGPRHAIAWGAVAAVLAFLLAGIQLVPTWSFLRETERSAIPVDQLVGQANNGSMVWRALFGWTASPIEDTDTINAIGFGATLLAFASLARRRTRRIALPLVAIATGALLLSWGALVPLWARVLPGFDHFHAPRRALLLWSAVGPAAAGLGAASLCAFLKRRRLHPAVPPLALAALSAGTVLMLPRLERVFANPARFDPDPAVRTLVGSDRFLALDPTMAYSYNSRRPDYGRSLMPDLACSSDMFDVQGYDPLVPRRYAMLRNLACRGSGVFYPSHGVFLTDPASPLLRLLGIRWLLGRWDLFAPDRVIPGTSIDAKAVASAVELVRDDERWPLFRYREERPMAWEVAQGVGGLSPERALAAAAANPRTVAFFEEDLAFTAQGEIGPWDFHRLDARTVEISTAAPQPRERLVCVAISWLEGWKAVADTAEPVVVFPADGCIAGVLLPPSARSVRLVYSPASFPTGALLTLGGVLLAIALWRSGRRPEPAP